MKRDNIYQNPAVSVPDFEFNQQVVDVFDDMISRSVPLYQEAQLATIKLANMFYQPNSTIYDLGCSTGTTLFGLCEAINDPGLKLVGVDYSKAMLKRCLENLTQAGYKDKVELDCVDITDCKFEKSSVVIANYTLQFIPPQKRLSVLSDIYNSLLPGGVVLISEKVKHEHAKVQEALTELHHDFKRAHGYSELEIAQKRDAIENVLIPLTSEQNFQLLQDAGFEHVVQYLKWYNFVSIIAVKNR